MRNTTRPTQFQIHPLHPLSKPHYSPNNLNPTQPAPETKNRIRHTLTPYLKTHLSNSLLSSYIRYHTLTYTLTTPSHTIHLSLSLSPPHYTPTEYHLQIIYTIQHNQTHTIPLSLIHYTILTPTIQPSTNTYYHLSYPHDSLSNLSQTKYNTI